MLALFLVPIWKCNVFESFPGDNGIVQSICMIRHSVKLYMFRPESKTIIIEYLSRNQQIAQGQHCAHLFHVTENANTRFHRQFALIIFDIFRLYTERGEKISSK